MLVEDVLVVDELEELEEEVDVLELEELEVVVELEDVDEVVLVEEEVEERADDEVAVVLEDARPDELLELLVVDEGGAAFVLALEDVEVCVEEVWDSAP